MNQTKATVPKSKSTNPNAPENIRNWLQDEMRLTAAYWQELIQPFIINRKLRHVEFEVARNAYCRVEETIANARQWNDGKWTTGKDKCNGIAGKKFSIPEIEFPSLKEFHSPELLLVDKFLNAETLAGIAAPMIGKRLPELLPSQAVQVAHDLLGAAQDYLDVMRKSQTRDLVERIVTVKTVSFDEIKQSNAEESRQLPLLPPVQKKRNSRQLNLSAIKAAVRLFYETCEEAARQQTKNDCLQNNRIPLADLCKMRWERFKKHSLDQQNRAIAREANLKSNAH